MQQKDSKRKTTRTRRKRGSGEPTDYTKNGREILDLAAAKRNDARAASQVLSLLDSDVVPLWLKESIEDALTLALTRKLEYQGPFVLIRRSATGEWLGVEKQPGIVKFIADLFTLTPGRTFTLKLTERERLARSISEILNSKLTPPRLEREVGDFINDTTSQWTIAWQNSPKTVERVLASGQCGYGSCVGPNDGSICAGPDKTGKHWKGVQSGRN